MLATVSHGPSVSDSLTNATEIIGKAVDMITDVPVLAAFLGLALAAGGFKLFKRARRSVNN